MRGHHHHVLHLVVSTPAELITRVYPNGKLGGLAMDNQPPGALGEFVKVVVRVRRPPREFTFSGQIAWARRKASKQLQVSYGVDFAGDEDATVTRMLAFARDEVPADATRFERRVPVGLPIKLLHGNRTRKDWLTDLSHGGAFVRTWNPIEVDEIVELVIRPPSSLFSVHLNGRVAWVRRGGEAPGMGIEFLDLTGTLRRDVDKLIGRARA